LRENRDIENHWACSFSRRADHFGTDILLVKRNECGASFDADHALSRSFSIARFQDTRYDPARY
jgi:hypothetical protein